MTNTKQKNNNKRRYSRGFLNLSKTKVPRLSHYANMAADPNEGKNNGDGNYNEKGIKTHSKCRNGKYGMDNSGIERFSVSDKQIGWNTEYKDYKPIEYTAQHIIDLFKSKGLPDPFEKNDVSKLQFNKMDELDINGKKKKIDRKSHTGEYKVVDGRPRYLRLFVVAFFGFLCFFLELLRILSTFRVFFLSFCFVLLFGFVGLLFWILLLTFMLR